jgi:hypothetical protein
MPEMVPSLCKSSLQVLDVTVRVPRKQWSKESFQRERGVKMHSTNSTIMELHAATCSKLGSPIRCLRSETSELLLPLCQTFCSEYQDEICFLKVDSTSASNRYAVCCRNTLVASDSDGLLNMHTLCLVKCAPSGFWHCRGLLTYTP